jgi:hypothetical protein
VRLPENPPEAAGKTHSEFGPEAAVAGVRAEKKQLIKRGAMKVM